MQILEKNWLQTSLLFFCFSLSFLSFSLPPLFPLLPDRAQELFSMPWSIPAVHLQPSQWLALPLSALALCTPRARPAPACQPAAASGQSSRRARRPANWLQQLLANPRLRQHDPPHPRRIMPRRCAIMPNTAPCRGCAPELGVRLSPTPVPNGSSLLHLGHAQPPPLLPAHL
jgi:hypothetical protein